MNINKDKALDDAEFAALEYIDEYKCTFEIDDAWMWVVVRQNKTHKKDIFLKKSYSNILPKRVRRYYEAYIVSIKIEFPIIKYGKDSNLYGHINRQAVATLVDSIYENFYHRLGVLIDYEIYKWYAFEKYDYENDKVIYTISYLPIDKSKLYNSKGEITLCLDK